jgi:hypothetical protein
MRLTVAQEAFWQLVAGYHLWVSWQLFTGALFERGDELGQVLFGDATQLADLDATELTCSEQGVDLVTADVQHVGDLLDRECLQPGSTSQIGNLMK